MTKKDYVLIASDIKSELDFLKEGSSTLEDDKLVIAGIVRKLSLSFLKDNPKFDTFKFYKACGVEI